MSVQSILHLVRKAAAGFLLAPRMRYRLPNDSMLTTYAILVMVVIAVHADPSQDAQYKIPAFGARYFCFQGYGCGANLHAECDAHCKNNTFLIGACQKIYYLDTTNKRQYDYHCCCYGETAQTA